MVSCGVQDRYGFSVFEDPPRAVTHTKFEKSVSVSKGFDIIRKCIVPSSVVLDVAQKTF